MYFLAAYIFVINSREIFSEYAAHDLGVCVSWQTHFRGKNRTPLKIKNDLDFFPPLHLYQATDLPTQLISERIGEKIARIHLPNSAVVMVERGRERERENISFHSVSPQRALQWWRIYHHRVRIAMKRPEPTFVRSIASDSFHQFEASHSKQKLSSALTQEACFGYLCFLSLLFATVKR